MTPEPTAQNAAPESAEPDTAALGRKSSRGTVALLLGLLLFAAALASFPLWREWAGYPLDAGGFEVEDLRAELSAATQRLAQLEARPAVAADDGRLSALEQAVKTAQTQAAAPSHLAADVDALSKQITEVRKTAADAATLLRLADRVEQVEASLREMQAKRSSAVALLLAVGQLREAVNLGMAFDAELRTVKLLAGEDAALAKPVDVLKDKAATGISTRPTLVDGFEILAPRVIRAEILPEGESWQRRVMDKLLALVTIRREDGSAAGSNAAAVVGRAQAALSRADLAGAISQMDSLGVGPAEAAAPWLAEAKARLAAEKALSEITAQVLAQAGVKP
ncbi:hypothetical protein CU669_00770 [Paramagnetospirillum kuznetsovii]|uniref:Inner membrane protein n=1 Tax=Paramagnetospirillum kuznetsovii TaxID=2053833 RepID=A0A364P2Y6_9PROT|nr:mitofilin family membrane protein [Paramagnetospirillum kuznetsovii]RAU23671.1 hypothetical protein CU669_00770 [Paramagnetospirillum kuznetsovii]